MVQLLSGGMTPHPQQPLSVPRGPLSICGFRLEGGINQQENANEGPSTGAAQGRPGVWGEVGDRGQEAGHSSRPGRGRGSNRTRHGEGGWRRGDLSGAPEGGAFLPAPPQLPKRGPAQLGQLLPSVWPGLSSQRQLSHPPTQGTDTPLGFGICFQASPLTLLYCVSPKLPSTFSALISNPFTNQLKCLFSCPRGPSSYHQVAFV